MISITTNKSWQDTDVINELITYYNNVAAFFGLDKLGTLNASAGGYIVDNDDKVCDHIKALQNGITSGSYCGRAVDPSIDFSGIAATADYPDDYSTLGLSQLYTDAGIPSGFRRVVGATPPADWTDYNDAAYSYGVAADGDMIGPWLFKDLQTLTQYIRAFKITEVRITSAYTGGEYVREEIREPGTDSGGPVGNVYTSNKTDHAPLDECDNYPDNSIINYMSIDSGTELDNGTYDHSWMSHYGNWVATAGDSAFEWILRHGRFALVNELFAATGGLGSRVKADYYGRIVKPPSFDHIWTYPYGSESTSTKKLAPTVTANSLLPSSDLIGGAEITDAASLFATRPDYPTDLESYGVRIQDAVIRIEMDWAAL